MSYRPEILAERLQVEDAVVGLFVATDRRDWPAVEAYLTDPVTLDMTSLMGGEPSRLKPQEVSAAWADGFRVIDEVHHQVGNFQTTVGANEARVQCYGIAFHYRSGISAPAKSRTFVGSYDMNLVKRNVSMTLRHPA